MKHLHVGFCSLQTTMAKATETNNGKPDSAIEFESKLIVQTKSTSVNERVPFGKQDNNRQGQNSVSRAQGNLRHSRVNNNPLALACVTCHMCTSTLHVIVVICIIPICCIVIAIIYWNKKEHCTVENVAVILLTGGLLNLFYGISLFLQTYVERRQKERTDLNRMASRGMIVMRIVHRIVQITFLVWFFYAAYIMYNLNSSVDHNKESAKPAPKNDCNSVLFNTCAWYVFLLVIICVMSGVSSSNKK